MQVVFSCHATKPPHGNIFRELCKNLKPANSCTSNIVSENLLCLTGYSDGEPKEISLPVSTECEKTNTTVVQRGQNCPSS